MDRDKVLLAAQKLVDKKRYDKAIAEYQKLVVDDPSDVRTMLKIGDLYLRLEAHGDAITTYERVGDYYHKQGFALKAIAVYKQIREIVHKHVPHLEDRFGHIVPRLAEIYTQLGLTSDALAAYDEVASRLQRGGRDRDAIDIFKKVVDLDPQNPLPHLRLAEAYIRVKGMDNAIEQFGAAASILLRLGRQDDALKVVERLLMHRADARFARMAAEIYLGRGAANDGMAALTKLQICFKEDPKDLETLALLARTFDHLGQPAKAVEVHKEAARIASDAGKQDEFAEIVELLMQRAPDDDAVKALVSQLHAMRAPPPPVEAPPSIEAVSLDSDEVSVELEDVEMLEEDVEEIEDFEEVSSEQPFALRQSQPPADQGDEPVAQVRRVLTEVEQLRRQRQYGPAITVLKNATDALPEFRELRERLCDLLIESGDQDGAIEQMLIHASHLSERGDADGAARILDEVLLLEPEHQGAVSMLGNLGYAVPEPSVQPPSSVHQDGAPAQGAYPAEGYQDANYPPSSAYQPPAPAAPGYDANQPLPSYDLDEAPGSASAPAARPLASPPAAAAAPPRSAGVPAPVGRAPAVHDPLDDLDDPFAAEPNAPLPSFPIEDEPPVSVPPVSVPTGGAPNRLSAPPVSVPPPISAPRPSMRASDPGHLDEEALEEIEFFSSHGMFDEARGILTEQLSRMPNHPILLEKQEELESLVAAASAQSGAREVPQADQDLDRSFDIAASLEALDALESPAPEGPMVDDQISVDTVFEQFKAGVAAQVAEGDAQTHYDLAVAYKEMGLLSDAISEMEIASKDPSRECVCQSMVGMWHLEQGNIEAAIDAFLRGFHAPGKDAGQELALTYEIGNAYELLNQLDQALYYFQKAAQLDPSYVDPRGSIEDRIAKLSPAPKAEPAKAAVGAEEVADEFDAAFEELLGDDDKLP